MQDALSPGLRAAVALSQQSFGTRRTLGQNFLLSDDRIASLLSQIDVNGRNVLEIGPGPGVMTAHLSALAQSVTAVEADRRLEPILTNVLMGRDNVRIVYADFMKIDLEALLQASFGDAPYCVVANLPYYITTDAVIKLVSCARLPEFIAVMVQKEAAQRLMAQPGSKDWNANGAIVRLYGETERIDELPPSDFTPPPHVTSAFIRIVKTDAPAPVRDMAALRRLIRVAFSMRRKKLVNNLKGGLGLSAEAAARAIERAGLPADVRGETLTLEDFARLSDLLTRDALDI